MPRSKPKSKTQKRQIRKPSRTPQILVICGVILLIAMILIFKEDRKPSASAGATSEDLAVTQLDRSLAEKRPTLAFFHSDNCQQCIIMMETVDQVFLEFSETVALVDINVYDEQNMELLKRVGLQYIPTLIFYDRKGQEQVSVGVMEPEILRQILADLAAGK